MSLCQFDMHLFRPGLTVSDRMALNAVHRMPSSVTFRGLYRRSKSAAIADWARLLQITPLPLVLVSHFAAYRITSLWEQTFSVESKETLHENGYAKTA